MTISDEISIIANQLANQGKVPSVALIKSKLRQPTPLPTIIAVLKTWQHDPNFTSSHEEENVVAENTDLPSTNEELKTLISQALLPLQQELQEVKTLLKQLLNEK